MYLGFKTARSSSHYWDKSSKQFFVDGRGLEHEVIQQNVRLFLGPEASVESVVHEVWHSSLGIYLYSD